MRRLTLEKGPNGTGFELWWSPSPAVEPVKVAEGLSVAELGDLVMHVGEQVGRWSGPKLAVLDGLVRQLFGKKVA